MWAVLLSIMPFNESVDVAVDASGRVPFPRLVVGLPLCPISVLPAAVVAVMMVGWWIAVAPYLPFLPTFCGAAFVLFVLVPGMPNTMERARARSSHPRSLPCAPQLTIRRGERGV